LDENQAFSIWSFSRFLGRRPVPQKITAAGKAPGQTVYQLTRFSPLAGSFEVCSGIRVYL
jgi:hypothetical protein